MGGGLKISPKSKDITYGWLLPILVKDSMRLHSSSPFSQIIPGPPHRYLPMVASIFLETLFIAWIFSNLKLTYCAMILMDLKLIACIVDKCNFFCCWRKLFSSIDSQSCFNQRFLSRNEEYTLTYLEL